MNIRDKLLSISPAAVDHYLHEIRHGGETRGIGTTKPGSLLKHQAPIRIFSEWNDSRPSFIEAGKMRPTDAVLAEVSPICIFESATGETFSVSRPSMNQREEA